MADRVDVIDKLGMAAIADLWSVVGLGLAMDAGATGTALALTAVGATLGAAAIPVIVIGIGVAALGSQTAVDQVNTAADFTGFSSPTTLFLTPFSLLLTPKNQKDPFLFAKAFGPVGDLSFGLGQAGTASDVAAALGSALAGAPGATEDLGSFYRSTIPGPGIASSQSKAPELGTRGQRRGPGGDLTGPTNGFTYDHYMTGTSNLNSFLHPDNGADMEDPDKIDIPSMLDWLNQMNHQPPPKPTPLPTEDPSQPIRVTSAEPDDSDSGDDGSYASAGNDSADTGSSDGDGGSDGPPGHRPPVYMD